MADRLEQRRNRITAAASTLVAFCAHYTNLIMASSTKPKERTHWTDVEVDALVDCMFDHRAEAGDGNFNNTTFNKVVNHLASAFPSDNPKTAAQIKSKWGTVRCQCVDFCYLI